MVAEDLSGTAAAGFMLTGACASDVNPVGRVKHLRLCTGHHFKIIQIETTSKAFP
jgi:hypothetical protein